MVASKDKKALAVANNQATSNKRAAQYHYKAKIEDTTAVKKVYDQLMNTPIMIKQGELLAAAPALRKLVVNACRVNRMPVAAPLTTLETQQCC